MDSLRSIGSTLPPQQLRSLANRDVESAPYAPELSAAEPNPVQPISTGHGSDPATDQQRMLHFISHVDASCFIALLQTMDPLPDDYRARAEYKRFYRQLHATLEVPLPPADAQASGLPTL